MQALNNISASDNNFRYFIKKKIYSCHFAINFQKKI